MIEAQPTATAAALLASPDSFRQWLQRHTGQYVGYCGRPDSCPIATFLRAQGYLEARVGSDLVWRFGSAESQEDLPIWAQIFVDAIDRDRACGVPVSSLEAQLALQNAVKDAESEASRWTGHTMKDIRL